MANVPLNVVRQRLLDAYNSGDKQALASAVRDYKQTRSSLRRSKANIAEDQRSYNPTAGMSNAEKLAVGNASGLVNIGRHAGLAGALLSGDNDKASMLRKSIASAKQTDAPLLDTGAGMTGRVLNEIAMTAPAGGAVGGGIRAIGAGGRALKAAQLGSAVKPGALQRAASYAAEGAVGGGLTEGEQGAAAGGALNLAVTPAMNRVGRLLRTAGQGMNKSAGAETIIEHGGDPTYGLMEPHTLLGRLERTAASSPIMGQNVAEARELATRPVVQNLAADVQGIARVPNESMIASAKRRSGVLRDAYAGIDEHALDPAELEKIRMGGKRKLNQAADARRLATREAERGVEAKDLAVRKRRSQLIKAEDRLAKNKNPDIEEALKEDVGIARRQLNAAQAAAADLNRRGPVLAGRAASREAREGFTHEATTELEKRLSRSLTENRMAKSDPLYKEVRSLANAVVGGKTTGAARKARSRLRELKASYQYGRNNRQPSMDAVRVLENVEGWFDDQLNRAFKSAGKPELAGQLKEADSLYAQTRALADSSFSAQKAGAPEIDGKRLQAALADHMPDETFAQGGGGKAREVAEALIRMREPHTAGIIERSPLLSMALGSVGVPVSAALATRPMRRMLQGTLGYQKAGKKLGKTKAAQILRNTLLGLRPGVAPALVDTQEE